MNTAYSHIAQTTKRPDLIFSQGEGSWLVDQRGKRYLDFVQAWAVNCLGHCPPELNHVIAQQASQLWNCGPAYYNQPQIELANSLVKHTGLDEVFFVSTGAEANEGAIKLARKWGKLHRGGAYKIVTMEGGFHGRTLATMSATGKSSFEPLFNPKVEGFVKVPFNDIDACRQVIDESVVAVMLEPIQGEAGVIPAQQNYLQALRTLCEEEGILLIFDEVQTGIGRTGALFATDHYRIKPDIMTLGKGLGGGVPLGAVINRREISCFETGDQGSTFSGNALMTAVGKAVVDIVADGDFLGGVRTKGHYLTRGLEAIFGEGRVRGAGLLLALDLPTDNAKDWVLLALDKGLLINAPNDRCLRFMPALNVSDEEIDRLLVILGEIKKSM
jgi:acetylornithine/N-succinyldiaminopimelate aminotransferase